MKPFKVLQFIENRRERLDVNIIGRRSGILMMLPLFLSKVAIAEPAVSGNIISWPDDGWYQVQFGDGTGDMCQGERSCEVADGEYIVINHSTGDRWESITVPGAEPEPTPEPEIVTITNPVAIGNTISWTGEGWYQVQDSSDWSVKCEGSNIQSCTDLNTGIYSVINHTTGDRWDGLEVVGADSAPSPEPTPEPEPVPEPEPTTALTDPPTVDGNTISWTQTGWHQVQDSTSFATICEGGTSCDVVNGVYIVINHDIGERWENIEVNGSTSTPDPLADADVRFGNYPGTSNPFCPPSVDYISGTAPPFGTWDDSSNYNYEGESYGCVTQAPAYVGDFASIRNPNAESDPDSIFTQQADVPSESLTGLIENITDIPDTAHESSGSGPIDNEGNFRVGCQYSHFGYNDSILSPGLTGEAHLHMFFGNTTTDANTAIEGSGNIADSGGGSCNGFELNRSAYWIPALLDGSGNAILPYEIIVYYKTKQADVAGGVQPMPQGLKMIAGNTNGTSFTLNDDRGFSEEDVFWSCGASGSVSNYRTTIPTDCRERPVNNSHAFATDGDPSTTPPDSFAINATIRFPQCLKVVDGEPVLDTQVSGDFGPKNPTHTYRLDYPMHNSRTDSCPAEFVRMPELSVLLYWKGPDDFSEVHNWRLSSDATDSPTKGGTLHADWIGGWNSDVMDNIVENCLTTIPGSSIPTGLNCGYGDLGDRRQLVRLLPDQWQGDNRVPKAHLDALR